MYNREIDIDQIASARYEKKLFVILNKEASIALLQAPNALGHRAILATMFAEGATVSAAPMLI